MSLLLVRHAHAGERGDWRGHDSLRPLTARGRHQAADLAGILVEIGAERVLSSPYRRCIETVAPTAAALGLTVEVDVRLAEGPHDDALELVRALWGEPVVLCSHGDVIPGVLGALQREDRLSLGADPRCAKGSTWILERDPADRGRYASATYLPAPR